MTAANSDTASLQPLGEQSRNIPGERMHLLLPTEANECNISVPPLLVLLLTLEVFPLLHEGDVFSPKMFLKGPKSRLPHCPSSCSHPGSVMLNECLMLLREALNHGLEPQGTFRDVLRVIAEPSLLTGMHHGVFLNLFK